MKIEYRFKSNILTKLFPIIWITIIIVMYLYSMMNFIEQLAYNSMLIYSVIFIFFVFMFRYFYIVYFLRYPVLVVDTKQIIYRSPLGLKTIPYSEISKIEKKFTFFVKYISVISENNSPINIPIEKFEDSSEDIYNLIIQMYNSSKTITIENNTE